MPGKIFMRRMNERQAFLNCMTQRTQKGGVAVWMPIIAAKENEPSYTCLERIEEMTVI